MADGLQNIGIPASPDFNFPAASARADEVSFAAAESRIRNQSRIINRPTLRLAQQTADIVAGFAMATLAIYVAGLHWLTSSVAQILPFALIPLAISLGLRNTDCYRLSYSRPVIDHMFRVATGCGLPLALLGVAVLTVYAPHHARAVLGASYLAFAFILVLHAHFVVIFKILTRRGSFSENVVLVGATANAQRLLERNQDTRELNVVGVFDDRMSRAPAALGSVPVLGRVDDLMNWDRLPDIDRIVVTVTSDARERVRTLISRLRVLPQRVVLLLDLEGFDPETESLSEIARSPAAYVSGAPNDLSRAVVKRAADLVFASLMLVAFSPLLLLTALAIKLESPGPVFFRQKRHGFNNQIIRVWKFRSMKHNPSAAEKITSQTTAHDPRVTRVGRIIRATSIDELPQLINVLTGEMSIVGPRPHAIGMTAEDAEVQNLVGDYAHRHRVKPGITGWAQINGSRGPVHTGAGVRERVRLDMEYVNRYSFWFDVFIMLATAPCLLGDWKKQR
ncbi:MULTISPECIES: exopolysaccharide biosynthesis polyprenyl glycosylphosphotransferase [Henriciella]|jgi:polysaccharide biosynthesis protein PslA|uniref:(Fe-S)-cluster assembly protein n=1 Tax=Henriciella pelagia TaxID=1977912 RepID=A0ABQ1K0X4_9PROT|nr:exopolysaccharide biosynthesis polyprenyl glycosylphosphotransferase [Henriciella pelagia]GGB80568.1 (Fe-S)-cluster assembly protein [Henriciella pelagia]